MRFTFTDNATEKKFVTNIVSSTLNDGKLSPNEAINAAISAGTQALKTTNSGSMTESTKGSESTTVGNFDDTEVTRLKNLGYDNKQIQAYFANLDELTDIFDTTPTTLPVDVSSTNTRSLASSGLDAGTLDYLSQIGIKTIDDIKDSGLSNQDILDMIGLNDENAVKIIGKKELTDLTDFLNLNNPAGKGDKADEVVVTGNRECAEGFTDNGTGLCVADDDIKKDDDLEEIVITDDKDKGCLPGFHDDGTGLCVADDDTKKDEECPEGYIRDLETGQCVLPTNTPPIKCGEGFKLSADGKSCVPIVKTTGPIKCTEGFELSADGKSCVPIKKKTTPTDVASAGGQNAPSQDPYANIKLMEELFGGDIAYKLRSVGATNNVASADLDAIAKLLRG
jgi:hypothetical protein